VPYVLRCFPIDDHAFARAANVALDAHVITMRDGADDVPRGISAALTDAYPLVAVRRGHQLAVVDPDETILYVYRDGSPIAR
jgi:hypothetical protein